MDQTLVDIGLQFAVAVMPVILGLLSLLGYRLTEYVKALTGSQQYQHASQAAAGVAYQVIATSSQEFLVELQRAAADGVVTPEELAEIRAKVVASAKAQLSSASVAALAKGFGDVDEALWVRIKTEMRS